MYFLCSENFSCKILFVLVAAMADPRWHIFRYLSYPRFYEIKCCQNCDSKVRYQFIYKRVKKDEIRDSSYTQKYEKKLCQNEYLLCETFMYNILFLYLKTNPRLVLFTSLGSDASKPLNLIYRKISRPRSLNVDHD